MSSASDADEAARRAQAMLASQWDEAEETWATAEQEHETGTEAAMFQDGVIRHTFQNGDVYDGEILGGPNPVLHGRGVLSFLSGARYEGEFRNNLKHGRGTFHYSDGSVYSGEWTDDAKHGEARYTFASGDPTYTGTVVDGRFHGRGVLEHEDGRRYEGEWQANKKHGRGVNRQKNGDVYEGGFVENKMVDDDAVITYASGRVFRGVVQDGKRVQGEMVHPDGRRYVGPWLDEKMHGRGKCWTKHTVYDGEYVAGKMHGAGRMEYTDHESGHVNKIYEGAWDLDRYHGEGTLWTPTGKVLDTTWDHGKQVGENRLKGTAEATWEPPGGVVAAAAKPAKAPCSKTAAAAAAVEAGGGAAASAELTPEPAAPVSDAAPPQRGAADASSSSSSSSAAPTTSTTAAPPTPPAPPAMSGEISLDQVRAPSSTLDAAAAPPPATAAAAVAPAVEATSSATAATTTTSAPSTSSSAEWTQLREMNLSLTRQLEVTETELARAKREIQQQNQQQNQLQLEQENQRLVAELEAKHNEERESWQHSMRQLSLELKTAEEQIAELQQQLLLSQQQQQQQQQNQEQQRQNSMASSSSAPPSSCGGDAPPPSVANTMNGLEASQNLNNDDNNENNNENTNAAAAAAAPSLPANASVSMILRANPQVVTSEINFPFEGYLFKFSIGKHFWSVNNWKKRYMKIDVDCIPPKLRYFESQTNIDNLKGEVVLRGARLIERVDCDVHDNSRHPERELAIDFLDETATRRTLLLRGSSVLDRAIWCAVLKQAIEVANGEREVPGAGGGAAAQ